ALAGSCKFGVRSIFALPSGFLYSSLSILDLLPRLLGITQGGIVCDTTRQKALLIKSVGTHRDFRSEVDQVFQIEAPFALHALRHSPGLARCKAATLTAQPFRSPCLQDNQASPRGKTGHRDAAWTSLDHQARPIHRYRYQASPFHGQWSRNSEALVPQ